PAPVAHSAATAPTPRAAPTPRTAPQPAAPSNLDRPAKLAILEAMNRDEVQPCVACELCHGRINTVFGEGDPDAPIMFIGEGPGQNEDEQGRPFVGRAGDLLGKMIVAMGLTR